MIDRNRFKIIELSRAPQPFKVIEINPPYTTYEILRLKDKYEQDGYLTEITAKTDNGIKRLYLFVFDYCAITEGQH